jgi:hypothetical protein
MNHTTFGKFTETRLVKEFSPESNIGEGKIRTVVLDGHSKPWMCKRKICGVHDQEGKIMAKI